MNAGSKMVLIAGLSCSGAFGLGFVIGRQMVKPVPKTQTQLAKEFHTRFDARSHELLDRADKEGLDTTQARRDCFIPDISEEEIYACGMDFDDLGRQMVQQERAKEQ